MEKQMDRRNFFKLAGATAVATVGAGALVGCGSKDDGGSTAAEHVAGYEDIHFEQEVDVLVVGAGIGGLFAAYAPAKAGKKVLVVDKAPTYGGDGMHSAACQFYYGSKYDQETRGGMTHDAVMQLFGSLRDKGRYENPDVVEQIFDKTGEVHDIMSYDFGVEWQDQVPGDFFATCYVPKAGLAETKQEFTAIANGVQGLGAEFLFDHRAKHLILDADDRVVGCRLKGENDGRLMDVKGNQVILCTGSFCANQEMVAQYLPEWTNLGCLVSRSLGEGHIMGMEAGAALEGVGKYCNLNTHSEAIFVPQMFGPSISVLPNGKRFYDEIHCHQGGQACVDSGFANFWSIWDKQIDEGPNASLVASAGNKKVVADTVEELAEKMQVPVEALKETFAQYDKMCETGEDPDFKRTDFLLKLNPPYFAYNNRPVRYMTLGGLLVNPNFQVLRDDGSVIEGLFAGGLLGTGSFSKEFATSAVSGYCAGLHAAELA